MLFGFGHIEIGTVTPKPQRGNNKPRLFRLNNKKSLLNSMGFNNDGVDLIAKRLKRYNGDCIIGANIGKNVEVGPFSIIEKHVKMNNSTGPDSPFSITFDELKDMTNNINRINDLELHDLSTNNRE